MPQATRDKIKRMLGINSSVTTYDATIDDLIDVADKIVLDDLGLSTFGITTYNEDYSFDFEVSELGLTYAPVVSVVALTMSSNLLTQGTDYIVDERLGYIQLKRKTFDIGVNKVSIEYTAGHDPVPSDIVYASNLIAVSLFNQQSHAGFKSERAGDYTYQMDSGIGSYIPAIASRILNKYRRLYSRGLKR